MANEWWESAPVVSENKDWWADAPVVEAKPKVTPVAQAPVEKTRTWGQAAQDTGVQLAEGVNTIAGAIPSLVSPEGSVAKFFNENADYWRSRQSEPLLEKEKVASAAISKAGEDGVLSQIGEAASQYFNDPALAARFITTNLPSMIPGIGAAKVAQVSALAKGATAAKAASIAGTASGGMNAVLNAGGARGDAFEDIKKTLIAQGMTPEQAEEQAIKDSRIVAAIGGIAGFVSGKTGLEKSILSGSGGVKAGLASAAKELGGEQLEELAPKFATNVQAAQYDSRDITKDIGRTAVETAIGAGPGAVVSGFFEARSTSDNVAAADAALAVKPDQARADEADRLSRIQNVETIKAIGDAPDMDAAIKAATQTLEATSESIKAVDNIANILGATNAIPTGDTTGGGRGMAIPTTGVETGNGVDGQGIPVDTGSAATELVADNLPLERPTNTALEGERARLMMGRIQQLEGENVQDVQVPTRAEAQASPTQEAEAAPTQTAELPGAGNAQVQPAGIAETQKAPENSGASSTLTVQPDQRLTPLSQRKELPNAIEQSTNQASISAKRESGTESRQAAEASSGNSLQRTATSAAQEEVNQRLIPKSQRTESAIQPVDSAGAAIETVAPEGELSAKAEPQQVETLGRDGVPISQGGKPFKTQKAAKEARKLQPAMRVISTDGGFVLAPKTEKQLAAEAKAAKRLAQPNTSPAGQPIPAHSFIASEGGLSKDTQADLGVGDNQKIGNRRLFAANGGLSIEQATQSLIERGYLPQGASNNQALELIKRSLTNPQYTPEGVEQLAQQEQAARFEDYLSAEQDASLADDFDPFQSVAELGYELDDAVNAGYDAAADAIKVEVNALLALAESQGIDIDAIKERAANDTYKGSEQDYYDTAKRYIQEAIEGSNRDSGANVSGEAETLTAPTREEVLAKQERESESVSKEKAQKRADDLAAQKEQERKEIAKASEAAAESFELGGDAMENLTGQKPMFSRKATETLDAAGITGKERVDAMIAINRGDITPEQLEAAYPAKNPQTETAEKPDLQMSKAEVKKLVTLHNLTEENLLYAEKMGGLPVPSIGITKVETPFGGFGDITLIGPKGLVDPESGVPVYDRDAWTARFPKMNFKKVKAKVADAFYEKMKPTKYMGNDGDQFLSMLWESIKNDSVQSPDKVIRWFESYNAPKMLYAKEVLGKDVKVPMRDVRLGYPMSSDKSVIASFNKNKDALLGDDVSKEESKAAEIDFGNAVKSALERYIATKPNPEASKRIYSDIFMDDGSLTGHAFRTIRKDISVVGTKEVDPIKFKENLQKVVKDNDDGYAKWVKSLVEPIFDEPTITLKGREVEPTLDNIVQSMTTGAVQGAEKSMTFSAGKVAAYLGKQFKSIEDIQSARNQVVSGSQEAEAKKEADVLLDEYRLHVSQFFTEKDWKGNIDTWAANDASMEALAKAGKMAQTEGNIRVQLQRMGFKNVDKKSIDLASKAIQAMRNAATDYFEAKPQRAVKLNEFKGAVVPKGTSQDAIAALENAGIEVEFYGKTDGARDKAIQKLAKRIDKARGDILFSKAPAPSTPIATIREAIKQAYGNLLSQLEKRGVTTITQTQEEAITAAAQARADKNGGDVAEIKKSLMEAVKNSIASQTDTPAFKRWFGDSKVVDADGNPLVVYHGTSKGKFYTFDPAMAGKGTANPASMVGHFFITDKDSAKLYSLKTNHWSETPDPNVFEVYLKIQNPNYIGEFKTIKEFDDALAFNMAPLDRVGDGIIAEIAGEKVYAVYDSSQIKSATENNGDFNPENLDIRYSTNGDIQGFYDPESGKSFLIADNLTAETAPAVLMHEVGIHAANDGSLDAVFKRATNILKAGKGNAFIDNVNRRMKDAGETSGEEAAAYITEAYEADRLNAPKSIVQFIKDFAAAIRAWAFKRGIIIKADDLSIADIAAIARANARNLAGIQATGEMKASIAKYTQSAAFKRWFGNSKVVNADGSPMMMFHGTPDASFNEFKEGSHFTPNPEYAAVYMNESASSISSKAKKANAPAVMPVYLKIEKPFDTRIAKNRKIFQDQYYYKFGTGTPLTEKGLPDWTDARDLLEWIEETNQPFDGIIVDEGGTSAALHRGFAWVPVSPTQIKSATGNNGDYDVTNPDIRRSAPLNISRGLDAFSKADELFALPKSESKDLKQIAKDNGEEVSIRTTSFGNEKMHTLTFSDGTEIRISDRKANPYGQENQVYAFDLVDGTAVPTQVGRVGENPEDVPPTDDVWLDVSKNTPGAYGAKAYNIAATYAHNNGKIFVGDPAGLSDKALRRRTEQMLSSALKFGTTEHLAPHPRQVEGDSKLGVPPLKWIYGDDIGNIERMIDVSLKGLENAGVPNDLRYDQSTGQFTDQSSNVVNRRTTMGRDLATYRAGIDEAQAGWRTLARAAFLRSFLGPNGRAEGSGILDRASNDVARIANRQAGGGAYPATERLFYSRQPNNVSISGTWQVPDTGRMDRLIFELQDQRIDLKRVTEAIEKAKTKIEEQDNARLAETLYSGRVAVRSENFLTTEVEPLLKRMAKMNVSITELSDYLHARGAPERNAQIAKVNPSMPDGGAGKNSQGVLLTTQAANDYIANLKPEDKLKLDSLANDVDKITKGSREMLVNEGLEKQSTVDAWEGAYKNYVPMFRDEAQEGYAHPTGAGFNVRGSASKRAMGSTKEVTNILAHVLMQREAIITRAEKNMVALSLYGMVLNHPNPSFWTAIRPKMTDAEISNQLSAMGVDPNAVADMKKAPTVRAISPTTGQVVERTNPLYATLPNALTLKVAGEDRVILFNENDERAMRLAQNLKNLDGLTRFDLAGSIIGKATRWLASVNTQYNPAFGIVNVTRDTLGALANLSTTPLKGQQLKVMADTFPAAKGIAQALRTGSSNKWSKLYEQFKEDGGQTGFKEAFKDANERNKAIESMLKKAQSEGKLTPGVAAHAVLDLLDDFNTTLENAVRLSAYSAALDSGMSRPEAARLGRELTVDFNRKGRAGREIGPLYAFFNAAVQGTARNIVTMKGPAGAKIIAGGLALGAIQALALAMAGYDDDELNEFVKTRALIIPIPPFKDKKFIQIPLPLGLHVIPNTGRVLTELSLSGGRDLLGKSMDAVGEIMSAFNPLGGGNIFTADGLLKTVSPTLVDPLIELGFNKNFAGSKIEKDYDQERDMRPGFTRARESTMRTVTGQAYIGISKALNSLTGGSDYESGKISPSPERLKYIAQTIGGGVLREVEKTINGIAKASAGEEVKSSQIPLAGRFYGEVDKDAVEQSRYYKNASKLQKLETGIKAAKKAEDEVARQKIIEENPEAEFIKRQNRIQQRLSKLNKTAVTVVNDQAEIKEIDQERIELMKELNDEIREMEESTKPTPLQRIRKSMKD